MSVAAAIAEARARWPELALDEAAIALTFDERAEPPVFGAELVLACACLAGDPAAVRYFHRDMFERVDRVLARLRLSPADADDVKQEVRTKLLLAAGKLAQYQGTGPLAQWVASVAGREALGMMRKRRPSEAIAEDDDLADASDDPGLRALKSQHGAELKHAFQAAVNELSARDRAVLRALIVDDRSVNEIATVYGIHRVTASRWISEIRYALLKGTRARLRELLRLDETSLDSAIRWVDSNLDMSLYRLLHETA
jgi:RNA polymerase sigma-70 factor (ECF subfamily)